MNTPNRIFTGYLYDILLLSMLLRCACYTYVEKMLQTKAMLSLFFKKDFLKFHRYVCVYGVYACVSAGTHGAQRWH